MVREEANDKKILKNNYKILSIFKCFVESIRIKIIKNFRREHKEKFRQTLTII